MMVRCRVVAFVIYAYINSSPSLPRRRIQYTHAHRNRCRLPHGKLSKELARELYVSFRVCFGI